MNEIICPKCKLPKQFKTKSSYYANYKRNTVCVKCRHIEHSEKLKGRKRPPFSKQWKRNIAIAHKNSDVWKASMNTPEYKEIHRQKMLKSIRNNQISQVGYNPKACEVFQIINQKLNWNGVHATNGKEKVVDVFFLDFYEPSLNIAIEWDEKHHRKAQHCKKDGFKQKIVTESINCEFYRIDDVTKMVRKVDKTQTDRTTEIQTVLNEYYETKN